MNLTPERRELMIYREISKMDRIYSAVMVGYLLMSFALIAFGAVSRTGLAAVITGLVMLPVAAFPVVREAFMCLRPVVLSDDLLRVPVGLGIKLVRPEDVAGIGLLYIVQQTWSQSHGWYPSLWATDGTRTELGRAPACASSMVLSRGAQWDALRRTAAGQLVETIYDWAVEKQGPTGPLAVQAMQKMGQRPSEDRDRGRPSNIKRWWSPDGSMGAVES